MLRFDDQGGLSDDAKRVLLVDHLLEVRRLAVELTGELPRAVSMVIARQAAELAAEQCGAAAMTAAACETIAEHCGATLDNQGKG